VSLTQLNSIALAQTAASGRKEGQAAHGTSLNGFSFGLSRATLRLKNEEKGSSPQLPSVRAQEVGAASAEKAQYSGILLRPRFTSDQKPKFNSDRKPHAPESGAIKKLTLRIDDLSTRLSQVGGDKFKDLVTPKCAGPLPAGSAQRNYHPKENQQYFARGKKTLPARKPVTNSDGKPGSALAPSGSSIITKAETPVVTGSRHGSRLTKALCDGEALGSKARLKANLVDSALHGYVVGKANTPACPTKPVSERKLVRKMPTVKAQAYREAVSLAGATDMMDVSETSIVFEQQNIEERAQGDLRSSVALPVQSTSTASASCRKA